MASRPTYQHLRTYNSGVNGDGQPLRSDVNEGEISINLSTTRMYTKRKTASFYPADSDRQPSVNHVYVDSDWGYATLAGKPVATLIGAKFRIYGISGFDSDKFTPSLRRNAGLYLRTPVTQYRDSDVVVSRPVHVTWKMNGGVDSEVANFAAPGIDPAQIPQRFNFRNPLSLDSDQNQVDSDGSVALPGMGQKMRYWIDQLYAGTTTTPYNIPVYADSEIVNSFGWNCVWDNTKLPGYPDSGTVYIWYNSTARGQIIAPVSIVPDSDFVRYVNYSQEDLFAIPFNGVNGLVGPNFTPSAFLTRTSNQDVVELLTDSTQLIPDNFSARVFTAGTPYTTATLNNKGSVRQALIIGNAQNVLPINPNTAYQVYTRVRQFSAGDSEVVLLNNVPTVGYQPPGYTVVPGASPPSTGQFWIDNETDPTSSTANPGALSWFDDTFKSNANSRSVAVQLARYIRANVSSTNAEARLAMLENYNLVYNGGDSEVTDSDTVWNEWRTIAATSRLSLSPGVVADDLANTPNPNIKLMSSNADIRLRTKPLEMGPYAPIEFNTTTRTWSGNTDGIDSDGWADFINTLPITGVKAGTAVRTEYLYVGPPSTRVVDYPQLVYTTTNLTTTVDVYYNGSRLLASRDFSFLPGTGYVVPTASWLAMIQPNDEILVVGYTPIVRDGTQNRTVTSYAWTATTRDSDIVLPSTASTDYFLTDVYVNGVYQVPFYAGTTGYYDYRISPRPSGGGYFVDFVNSPVAGDVVNVLAFSPVPLSFTTNRRRANYWYDTQPISTVFTVPRYAYDSDGLEVQLNGVTLQQGTDYTWTTTLVPDPLTTITIQFAMVAGDVLSLITYGTDNPQT